MPVTQTDIYVVRVILRATLHIQTAQTPEDVREALGSLQAAGVRPVWEVVNAAVDRIIAIKEKA